MNIDIIIITHRIQHIKNCLNSIIPFQNNTIVIFDGNNKEIAGFLGDISRENKFIKYLPIDSKAGKSMARNAGIKYSKSDIIYFLDDDAYFTEDNLKIIKHKLSAYPDVSVIGGPNLTPPGSSYFQRVSGHIFSSVFTAWKMSNRYMPNKEAAVCDDKMLILCNLAVKREVFIKENLYFDERLDYNEENLLLQQLKERGYKMLYCPELAVYHLRRDNVFKFSKQIYKSGNGRAIMSFIMPKTLSPVHAMPALFVIYLIYLICAKSNLAFIPLFMYTAVNFINAIYVVVSNKEKISAIIPLFVLSFIAHVSYGAGFIRGLLWKIIKLF